jgi:hypothetical protein
MRDGLTIRDSSVVILNAIELLVRTDEIARIFWGIDDAICQTDLAALFKSAVESSDRHWTFPDGRQ